MDFLLALTRYHLRDVMLIFVSVHEGVHVINRLNHQLIDIMYLLINKLSRKCGYVRRPYWTQYGRNATFSVNELNVFFF